MRDMYKILNELHKRGVSHCLQYISRSDYYNLKVDDIHGKTHYLTDDNMNDMEEKLKVLWGHLLDKPKTSLPPGLPGLPTL